MTLSRKYTLVGVLLSTCLLSIHANYVGMTHGVKKTDPHFCWSLPASAIWDTVKLDRACLKQLIQELLEKRTYHDYNKITLINDTESLNQIRVVQGE